MICPYNGFKECLWDKCAARMKVKDPQIPGQIMKVCAIAYNGGSPVVIQQGEERVVRSFEDNSGYGTDIPF